MVRISKYLAILILVLAVVSIGVGTTFIVQAQQKENWMQDAMRVEKVALDIPAAAAKAGDVIDTPQEAQAAADTIRKHRRNIAPTYEDLLGGKQYDPTDLKQLTYTQAINMENYLYLAVLGFGVTTALKGAGAFMILSGITFGATGTTLLGLNKRTK